MLGNGLEVKGYEGKHVQGRGGWDNLPCIEEQFRHVDLSVVETPCSCPHRACLSLGALTLAGHVRGITNPGPEGLGQQSLAPFLQQLVWETFPCLLAIPPDRVKLCFLPPLVLSGCSIVTASHAVVKGTWHVLPAAVAALPSRPFCAKASLGAAHCVDSCSGPSY